MREVAKTHLESLTDFTSLDRIMLGRRVRIARWVVEGFADLVRREETISDDEAIDIDCDVVTTCYKLFRLRELKIAGRLGSVTSHVEETFREELERIRSDEKNFNNDEILRMQEEKTREEEAQQAREAEELLQKELEELEREKEMERKAEEEMLEREREERQRAEEEEIARQRQESERREAERRATLGRRLGGAKGKKSRVKGGGGGGLFGSTESIPESIAEYSDFW